MKKHEENLLEYFSENCNNLDIHWYCIIYTYIKAKLSDGIVA